jgi:hypothetical protein
MSLGNIVFGIIIVVFLSIAYLIYKFMNFTGNVWDFIKSPFEKSYGRSAGTPMVCADGKDTDGGLCYQKCSDGYKGVGPVCWQKCPDGYQDIGVSCKKPTYDRGVGKVPSNCGDDESDAGLCYKKCKDGYKGVGPVCWEKCKDGYRDDGAICTRDVDTISRDRKKRTDVGRIPDYKPCPSGYRTEPVTCMRDYSTKKGDSYCKKRDSLGTCWEWGRKCPDGYKNMGAFCARDAKSIARDKTCKSDEEMIAGLCYPRCDKKFGSGWYSPSGDVLYCVKPCPDGYTGAIATCTRNMDSYAKKSYGRGAGDMPKCSSGQESDAGLCYDKPRDGYKCTATICTKGCPSGMRDDGLYCGKDSKTRGAGTVPDSCPSGKEPDNKLCYEKCKDGYKGVGPVCWEDMIVKM